MLRIRGAGAPSRRLRVPARHSHQPRARSGRDKSRGEHHEPGSWCGRDRRCVDVFEQLWNLYNGMLHANVSELQSQLFGLPVQLRPERGRGYISTGMFELCRVHHRLHEHKRMLSKLHDGLDLRHRLRRQSCRVQRRLHRRISMLASMPRCDRNVSIYNLQRHERVVPGQHQGLQPPVSIVASGPAAVPRGHDIGGAHSFRGGTRLSTGPAYNRRE